MNSYKPLKDSVTFVFRQNNIEIKAFKVFFAKDHPDFYVAFPYLKINSFRCGKTSFIYGVEKTIDTTEDIRASVIPVKFSYHESGAVHFKPVNPDTQVPASLSKLAELNAVPIKDFNGRHIFTIHLEGIEHFEKLSTKDQKKDHVIYDLPPDCELVKVVGFAGFSDAQVDGKYKDQSGNVLEPSAKISLTRPSFATPLFIAMYVIVNLPSLQQQKIKQPYILSLVGFKMNNSQDKVETLFLHATSLT